VGRVEAQGEIDRQALAVHRHEPQRQDAPRLRPRPRDQGPDGDVPVQSALDRGQHRLERHLEQGGGDLVGQIGHAHAGEGLAHQRLTQLGPDREPEQPAVELELDAWQRLALIRLRPRQDLQLIVPPGERDLRRDAAPMQAVQRGDLGGGEAR
jgi:hypothetical protein